MKTGLSVMALGIAMMLGSLPAHAADLINEDEVPYAVLVDGDMEVTIEPMAEVATVCDSCTIQLTDSFDPPLSLTPDTVVVIRDGKLVIDN